MFWKVLGAVVGVFLIGYIAYGVVNYRKAGWDTRPQMKEGEFSISFKSGLRAILSGVPNLRESRRYLGYPSEIPFFLEGAWSYCYPATPEDLAHLPQEYMSVGPLSRLEVVCWIEHDGERVHSGFIYTVPKL